MTKPSLHKCPACGGKLSVEVYDTRVLLFCPHGRCWSQAANDGAVGFTEGNAYKTLRKLMDAEPVTFAE